MKYYLKNIDVKTLPNIKDGSEYLFTFGIRSDVHLVEDILQRTIFISGRHEAAFLFLNPKINFINFAYSVCEKYIINEVERGLIELNRNYNIANEEISDFNNSEFIQGHEIELNSKTVINREVWEKMKKYIIDRLKKEKHFVTTSGQLKNLFEIGLPFAEHDIFYNDLLQYCKEDKVNFSFKSYYREEKEPQIIFDIEFFS